VRSRSGARSGWRARVSPSWIRDRPTRACGCFRAVFTEDLRHATDDESRLISDLRSLERQGLIEERTVTCLRDHTTAGVITVTKEGKALLESHREPGHDQGQQYYAGWSNPQRFGTTRPCSACAGRCNPSSDGTRSRCSHRSRRRVEGPGDAALHVSAEVEGRARVTRSGRNSARAASRRTRSLRLPRRPTRGQRS
jgi:hypothetical protein